MQFLHFGASLLSTSMTYFEHCSHKRISLAVSGLVKFQWHFLQLHLQTLIHLVPLHHWVRLEYRLEFWLLMELWNWIDDFGFVMFDLLMEKIMHPLPIITSSPCLISCPSTTIRSCTSIFLWNDIVLVCFFFCFAWPLVSSSAY